MKQYTCLVAACLFFLLSACNSDKKEIETNALGYLQATSNYLIDDAMPYATKETRENALTFLRDNLIPMTPQEYIQSNTPATIVIDNIEIVNDTAHVKYTKTTPIQTLENEIMMVQEDGHWLVYVPLVLPENLHPTTAEIGQIVEPKDSVVQ